MTNVRLTLSGLSREAAEEIANQLIAEWHPASSLSAAHVLVIGDEDVAREQRDADLLRRLRQVHIDLSETEP